MSFKHARDALVLCHDNGVIGDEEFCLLYDANRSKNPEFPYEEYGKFDLEDMEDDECKAEFCFHKEDMAGFLLLVSFEHDGEGVETN